MTTARHLPQVLRRSVRGVLAGLLTAVFLAPFYLMLRNALMDTQGLTSPHWTWWPSTMHWDNFTSLFSDPTLHMGQALGNSLLIAAITAPVSTLLASAAGYALARIPVPGRGVLLALVVATLMIPGSVTFVPTFVVVGSMGGVNTLWGIIAPGLFNPFAVLLFRNFYLQFPSEIEEAGRLDGLGWLGLYRRIALPSSGAMLASLGALAFIDSWNAFLWPLVIGQDPSSWTAQIALSTFLTSQTVNLPGLFAGAVVTIAPLVAMFLVAQRYIVEGIATSGLKG
ncbi:MULTISPECIES: carbohydrate ABC transporter permease [unclassified Streptomyces]|uniref:carbohydrate ABC transporter permease n=1 Tax=unclassified Streptomyces TaxID=2593676 RepID=UPI00225A01C3|nr:MULTISPECIES: carbohydrate ABC transporter permease [unclassified Streptomyces]WSP55336.1 carbohydrate ABC transporter permease [Streptomyces sp. NBC_01241]WSU23932.1 carbohydrate ABC transporter permease [Streptomyces sp. NBC_01108]MCX4787016.1 carbohydrate ABC transporter permease [Streptomyces sp. NBC_01221]MCX4797202.1 carbohydrate ABC transporter permease [Streptomyces sp. NBC_01242]WSJ38498.1 carbohydrate ABC transporter permease [Streptomyces sp. NBC_01321]